MISPEQTIAVKLCFYFIALLAIAARFYIRWWLACHINYTDIVILIALLLYTTEEGIAIALWKSDYFTASSSSLTVGGLPSLKGASANPVKASLQLALIWWSTFLTFTIFWAIKASFLLLYYSVFPHFFVKLRWALHITSVVTALTYIGFLITNVFNCGANISRNWSVDPNKFCYSYAPFTSFIYLLTTHFTTDLIIYILPFFLLPHLKLPKAQKAGVIAMFALGIICVLCTLARSVTVWASKVFPMKSLLVWDSVEITLGIIVGCGPSFKWLIKRARKYPRGLAIREYGRGGRRATDAAAGDSQFTYDQEGKPHRSERKGSRGDVIVLGDVDIEGDGEEQVGWFGNGMEIGVEVEVHVDVDGRHEVRTICSDTRNNKEELKVPELAHVDE